MSIFTTTNCEVDYWKVSGVECNHKRYSYKADCILLVYSLLNDKFAGVYQLIIDSRLKMLLLQMSSKHRMIDIITSH